MKKMLLAASVAAACTSYAGALQAQQKADSEHTFTGNFTLASEYRYRGIAQTNSKPTVQGGFDYGHASGIYLGTWASNVSWLSDAGAGAVSNSLEWDFYGGYKGTFGDFGYDVGLLYYYYPGTYPSGFVKPNTTEIYGAVTWQMLTLKYSHSLSNIFGFADSKGSGYLDLTGNFDLGDGYTLVGHVGHQTIASSDDPLRGACSGSNASYTDFKVGATKEFYTVTWGLSYIGTNAKGDTGECYRNAFGKDLGRGTVVLSASKTF